MSIDCDCVRELINSTIFNCEEQEVLISCAYGAGSGLKYVGRSSKTSKLINEILPEVVRKLNERNLGDLSSKVIAVQSKFRSFQIEDEETSTEEKRLKPTVTTTEEIVLTSLELAKSFNVFPVNERDTIYKALFGFQSNFYGFSLHHQDSEIVMSGLKELSEKYSSGIKISGAIAKVMNVFQEQLSVLTKPVEVVQQPAEVSVGAKRRIESISTPELQALEKFFLERAQSLYQQISTKKTESLKTLEELFLARARHQYECVLANRKTFVPTDLPVIDEKVFANAQVCLGEMNQLRLARLEGRYVLPNLEEDVEILPGIKISEQERWSVDQLKRAIEHLHEKKIYSIDLALENIVKLNLLVFMNHDFTGNVDEIKRILYYEWTRKRTGKKKITNDRAKLSNKFTRTYRCYTIKKHIFNVWTMLEVLNAYKVLKDHDFKQESLSAGERSLINQVAKLSIKNPDNSTPPVLRCLQIIKDFANSLKPVEDI